MSGDITEAALARIDRALARIEAASTRPAAGGGSDRALAKLSQRHNALLAETRAAISDVDALIRQAGGTA